MDISSFKAAYDIYNSGGMKYEKDIGCYTLGIYIGNWLGWGDLSEPTNINLDINNYISVSLFITEVSHCSAINLNKDTVLCAALAPLSISHFSSLRSVPIIFQYLAAYIVSMPQLEVVYKELNKIAMPKDIVDSSLKAELVRQEKPCKHCGRLNDVGAPICWGFTCGASNPTG